LNFSFKHVCCHPKWSQWQWMSSSAKKLTLSLVGYKKIALNDWKTL
jgi:hypothetical protein